MGMRHVGLVMALALAPYGQPAHGQPPAAHAGAPARQPGSHHRPSPAVSRRTWFVNGVHGSNRNNCESRAHACKTIAHAIALTAPGDAVVVAPATYRENLTINHSLKIAGSGAASTIVDGRGVASVILSTDAKAVVTVSGVTLRDGGGLGDGGGIYHCTGNMTLIDTVISGGRVGPGHGSLGYGGAIYNCPGSTLTISGSTFVGNSAIAGGAICNGGRLTIRGSAFIGNVARGHRGGAIFNYGTLTISNSTFSENRAPLGRGGGIHNGQLFGQLGTATISNSTVSGNIAAHGLGGGIFTLDGALTMIQDSIVAGNTGGNCHGLLVSQGYNLSSDGTCAFQVVGDLNNTDPRLGPLRGNGGPAPTMALLPGSPAIDAGNPKGCTGAGTHLLKTDQRGEPRPDGEDSGGCDMGAYERQGD